MQARAEGSQRWRPKRVLWHTVRSPARAFERRLARRKAGMAELVDALDSKSSGATRVGSTPTLGTTFKTRRRGRATGCDSRRPRECTRGQKNTKAGFSSARLPGIFRTCSSQAVLLVCVIADLVRGASATPARQVQRGGDGARCAPGAAGPIGSTRASRSLRTTRRGWNIRSGSGADALNVIRPETATRAGSHRAKSARSSHPRSTRSSSLSRVAGS